MTHKQQAIELLNTLAAFTTMLPKTRWQDYSETLGKLRVNITLMEQRENPADGKFQEWRRTEPDYFSLAATNAREQAAASHYALDDRNVNLARVPLPRGPIEVRGVPLNTLLELGDDS